MNYAIKIGERALYMDKLEKYEESILSYQDALKILNKI